MSMQIFVFLFLVLFVPLLVVSQDQAFNNDVLGLIVFKAGLNDPKGKLSTWNEDDNSPCNWEGIKCDPSTKRVSAIILDGFSLSGHIGKGLMRLQFLQILSLSRNNFTGTINPDLLKLWNLKVVDLSENNLFGSIPDGLFNQCWSLRVLSFAKNNLTGKIPDSLNSCFSLASLNFSSNRLTGQLPYGMWFLRELQSLDLSNNMIEGDIPEGIQNLYDLRELRLGKNNFSGEIPEGIGGCLLLKLIDFSGNFLYGKLPESIQRLTSCSFLSLQGNSFTGNIPHWIGELKSLEILDLSGNRFSGQIPVSIGYLDSLSRLNLSMNQITGNLPYSMVNCIKLLTLDISHNHLKGLIFPWIFKIGVQSVEQSWSSFNKRNSSLSVSYHGLQVLDLSSNAFSGQIPSVIGGLSSLQVLNFSTNNISGSIPVSIRELKSLYILDLSNNKLNGSIPKEIEGAISLGELRLQKNLLGGTIPGQIAKCSTLTSLNLAHNKLNGSIPTSIAELSNLQYVDFSWNELSGSIPKKMTNLTQLFSFNVSYNHLQGELPLGGFFNNISPSFVSGNPLLCGSVVNQPCPSIHPKPIVLNPNSNYSNSRTSLQNHHHKIMLSVSVFIAIGAAICIAIGLVIVTFLNIHVRSSMSHSHSPPTPSGREDYKCSPSISKSNDPNCGKLVMFSGDAEFNDGVHSLFNNDREIGRGGFGIVYFGVLSNGHSVAIKNLAVSSLTKSREDFEKEVTMLGEIKHQNLVTLEGYYWTSSLQVLIYEYLARGSLNKLLHDDNSTFVLSWRQRFKVVLGMAKGLSHLHQMKVIHYNLKSSNVLIDCFDEAKIGDFGLVRLLPILDHCVLSSKVQSALGYMAPEFACSTSKITEKCDVYGFGILVLEVVTGKRPVEYMDDDVVVLCDMVRGALENGKVDQCVDEKLVGNFVEEEAIPLVKLGLVCASQVPLNRPDMVEVVNILEMIQCSSEGQEEL